jgi:hypothetical protein
MLHLRAEEFRKAAEQLRALADQHTDRHVRAALIQYATELELTAAGWAEAADRRFRTGS